MKLAKTLLQESGITRIIAHNMKHDCAIITAFRTNLDKKLNLKNNKILGYALNKLGYGATKVIGTYEEEILGLSTKENSWFVVNLKDDPSFISNILKFGEVYNQDSVLIIPKNGFFDINTVYLIGTNDNEFCPKGQKLFATNIKFGKNDNKLLIIIKHKPFYFIFDDIIRENFLKVPLTNTLMMMNIVEKEVQYILKNNDFKREETNE